MLLLYVMISISSPIKRWMNIDFENKFKKSKQLSNVGFYSFWSYKNIRAKLQVILILRLFWCRRQSWSSHLTKSLTWEMLEFPIRAPMTLELYRWLTSSSIIRKNKERYERYQRIERINNKLLTLKLSSICFSLELTSCKTASSGSSINPGTNRANSRHLLAWFKTKK